MANTITCFLVDDDADDQEIFRIALKGLDIEVNYITADDGYFALKMLNDDISFIPNYIFLDLNMPRVNGIQCLKGIKEMTHLEKVPVIIYTTSSDQHSKQEAFDAGANGFITKPFAVDDLTKLLDEVFTSRTSFN